MLLRLKKAKLVNCSKLKSSFVLWAINYELNDFIN